MLVKGHFQSGEEKVLETLMYNMVIRVNNAVLYT